MSGIFHPRILVHSHSLEMISVPGKMDLNKKKVNSLAPRWPPSGISHGPSREPGLLTLPSLSNGNDSVHYQALFSPPQAIQIMNGLFHIALGGLLLIPTGIHTPICVAVWYPLWGGVMVSEKTMTSGEAVKKKC